MDGALRFYKIGIKEAEKLWQPVAIIKLEPRANSNQNRFPLDFRHTFTVILPSVTRTPDNSKLPLTRTNFRFPSGHFLYNFTFDNSNHVCQYVTSQNTVVQNLKFILKQPCELFPFFYITQNMSVQFKFCWFSQSVAS